MKKVIKHKLNPNLKPSSKLNPSPNPQAQIFLVTD